MDREKWNIGFIIVLGLILIFLYFYQSKSIRNYATGKDYSVVMTHLQEGLIKRGYEIEKIQPIDQGLKKAGFEIEKYRVIYFNPKHSIESIQKKHPKFSALLPLSITLAVESDSLKITGAPFKLLLKSTNDKVLLSQIRKWKKDSEQIIKEAL